MDNYLLLFARNNYNQKHNFSIFIEVFQISEDNKKSATRAFKVELQVQN